MREIIEKRRPHCKVFDLGGRKRKVRVSRAPLHYHCDGKLEDIDTTPLRGDRHFEVTKAPYRLKIDPEQPAYLYVNENGRQVEVELIGVRGAPVQSAQSIQEDAGVIRWANIAPQADVIFKPLRKGIEALVVLYGPDAPRQWKWRVRGDKELLLPPKGHDAKQQTLELQHSYDGDILSIEWTGRVTNRRALRTKEGWTDGVVYPVAIDPTVNEAIVDGADDVLSVWNNNGNSFFTFVDDYFLIPVGRAGPYRTYGGLRFQSIPVPNGATITSAALTIDILGGGGSPNILIFGDDVDDAPQWANPSSRIKNITKTTAFAQITPSVTGPYPIGITGIIQEIIDRTGWASGNNMRFGFFNNQSSTGNHGIFFASFEHATRTEAQLEIEYEEAAEAIVAPKMMHYMRLHNG